MFKKKKTKKQPGKLKKTQKARKANTQSKKVAGAKKVVGAKKAAGVKKAAKKSLKKARKSLAVRKKTGQSGKKLASKKTSKKTVKSRAGKQSANKAGKKTVRKKISDKKQSVSQKKASIKKSQASEKKASEKKASQKKVSQKRQTEKTLTKNKKVITKTKSDKKSGAGLIKKTLSFLESELEALEKKEAQSLKNRLGQDYCMVENCDYPAVIEGYCRLHYFAFYERITKKKEILEKDLFTKQFLELVNQHSESVLNFLLKDLSSDRHFKIALKKMYLDEEANDMEESF